MGLLEAAGIGAWVDHEDITGAQLWAGEIAETIDATSDPIPMSPALP